MPCRTAVPRNDPPRPRKLPGPTHARQFEKDRGQANAINIGFTHTPRGEIMAYLNSDDLLLPGTLNYVAAFFAADPGVDVVYGHRVVVNRRGGSAVGCYRITPTRCSFGPITCRRKRCSGGEASGRRRVAGIDESFQHRLALVASLPRRRS